MHKVVRIYRYNLRERGVAAGDSHFLFIHPDFVHEQAQIFFGECPVLQELLAYQPGERVDVRLLQDVRWHRGLGLDPGDVGQYGLALHLQFVGALAQRIVELEHTLLDAAIGLTSRSSESENSSYSLRLTRSTRPASRARFIALDERPGRKLPPQFGLNIAPSPWGRKAEMAGKEWGFRCQHGAMMTRLIRNVTPESVQKMVA